MFEHITVLLSFIYAIATTHLLSSATELILARERVRISWLLLGWMAVALLLLVSNWLSFAPLSAIKHWTLGEALLQFVEAFIQYFTCSLVSMRVEKDGVVDMRAYFTKQRPVILLAILALGVDTFISNYLDRNNSGLAPGGWMAQDLLVGAMSLIVAMAILVRARWAQIAAIIGMLASSIYFMVQFVTLA